MDYAVVYERSGTGYAAYIPDLPGCVATGSTRSAVERRIRSAVRLHLKAVREDGQAVPSPTTWAEVVRV